MFRYRRTEKRSDSDAERWLITWKVCFMCFATSLSSSVLWNQADHFIHLCVGLGWRCIMHTGKTYSLPYCAAEDIPHTWQHWLKIAQKPLILHNTIFPLHALDPRSLWSRFNISGLPGYLALNIFLKLKDDINSALFIIFPFFYLYHSVLFDLSLWLLQTSRRWILFSWLSGGSPALPLLLMQHVRLLPSSLNYLNYSQKGLN